MANVATITGKAPSARNVMAAGLSQGQFRKQIVRAKAGKGSYRRKAKHAKAGW